MERLLLGYGFQLRHGGNHDIFGHLELEGMQFVLPRHANVKKAYVKKAVGLVDRLGE